jgi:hypothetical protein
MLLQYENNEVSPAGVASIARASLDLISDQEEPLKYHGTLIVVTVPAYDDTFLSYAY